MGHSHIPQEAELGKDRTFRHPGAQVPSCSCGAFKGIPGFPGCPGGDGASHRYLTFAAALTLLCTCPPSPTNLSKNSRSRPGQEAEPSARSRRLPSRHTLQKADVTAVPTRGAALGRVMCRPCHRHVAGQIGLYSSAGHPQIVRVRSV